MNRLVRTRMPGGVGGARSKPAPIPIFGTPVMAYDFWGVSPLYENEDLKVGRVPTVTLIDQVLDEGNCGEVTNRGEEACECAVKLTKLWEVSAFCDCRRQPHSGQSCDPPVAVEELRTETGYKAGSNRRVSQPSRSRLSSFGLVNPEVRAALAILAH